MQLLLTTSQSHNKRTLLLTFAPRYRVFNNTDHVITVLEAYSSLRKDNPLCPSFELAANSDSAFWPILNKRMIVLRLGLDHLISIILRTNLIFGG
jgi:hypothetical protein